MSKAGGGTPVSQTVPLDVYVLRGGAPPHRGYYLAATVLLTGPRGGTVSSLVAPLQDESEDGERVFKVDGATDTTGVLARHTGKQVSFVAMRGAPEPTKGDKWLRKEMQGHAVALEAATIGEEGARSLRVVALVAFTPGTTDVGEFVSPSASSVPVPGCGEWADLTAVPKHVVHAVAAAMGGSAAFLRGKEAIVDAAVAASVVAFVRLHHARGTRVKVTSAPRTAAQACAARIRAACTQEDFKLVVPGRNLAAFVGSSASKQVATALGRAPDLVVLRRTEAQPALPRGVALHTDVGAARTAHVWLSGGPGVPDPPPTGGQLVYIDPTTGAVNSPPVFTGMLSCHDASVVHGVTPLTSGVRYVLLALRVDP